MERILLINNKSFFDFVGVITINEDNMRKNIPKRDSVFYLGKHNSNDNPNRILKNLFQILPKLHTYIIIVGKSDNPIKSKLVIPDNIKYIYANNINYNHEKIKFLPIGIDFRSSSIPNNYDFELITNLSRDILCYCNFSLNTNSDRLKVFNFVKDKDFVTKESMGTFLKYTISYQEYKQRLSISKFVICPPGKGKDTYRFYDTLYSGAIPIVIRELFHENIIFDDLPILFMKIQDFETITESFLNDQYKILCPKIKTYYPSLDFRNLINQIKSNL